MPSLQPVIAAPVPARPCPAQALVERYTAVQCDGLTVDGEPLSLHASGWQARILQHECDHLQVCLCPPFAAPSPM